MAAIGAVVGTAVISTIARKLISFTVGEAVKVATSLSHRDLVEELRSLELKLRLISDLLDDADTKQTRSEGVRAWLEELKDAAYDAEDVLDEYATDAALLLQRKGPMKWIKGKVNKLGLENKIKGINGRFDQLSSARNNLGLQKLETSNEGSSRNAQGRETSSLLDIDSPIIGRDDVREEIIMLLTSIGIENSTRTLPVLPIVGMGGVGKTSLARLVFHDNAVKKHFSLRIWISVSQDFDVNRMLRSIIECVYADMGDGKTCTSTSLEILHSETKKLIEKRRFLLILDDAWNEQQHQWEQLLKPLKYGENGSKVLVTTRSENVAKSIQGHMDPIELGAMDSHYIWEILVRCAFNGVPNSADEQMINIGKQIVKKLKGSPLAAKTIGRLLGTDLDKNHWKKILESDFQEIKGQKEDEIIPSLLLSYQYLPPALKICFSLCSLFPKGHQIPKDELSYLWIAHDIFQLGRGTRPEDSAFEAIRDLRSRSLLEQGKDDGFLTMHDLIHDVSEYIAHEDHLHITGKIILEKHPNKLRHLSSFSNVQWEFQFPQDKLRSVLCIKEQLYYDEICDHRVLHRWLNGSTCLRVLNLEGCGFKALPNSIGNLKHLRYLNLSSTKISKLPKSLTSLYNLQFLWLPFFRLKSLPDGMSNLVNLRIFNAGSEIKRIGRLISLQELRCFDVGRRNGRGIEELENLDMLRGKLSILSLEKVVDPVKARKARLQRKEYLQGLTIKWTDGCTVSSKIAEEVLEFLQPNGDRLNYLEITNYKGMVLPSWLTNDGHLPSLKQLKLENWENCEDTDLILCNLNSLESLELKRMCNLKCIRFDYPPSLLKLSIVDCRKLSNVVQHHLPTSLEELDINGCGIEDESLRRCLHGVTSLRRLSLYDCPNLTDPLEKEVVISLLQRLLLRSVREKGVSAGFHIRFSKNSWSTLVLEIRCPPWSSSSFEFKASLRGRWVWELLQHYSSHLGRLIQELEFSYPGGEIVEDGEMEELFVPLTNLSKLQLLAFPTLPTTIDGLSSLQELELKYCPVIQTLPASLQKLSLHSCEHPQFLPSSMMNLSGLQSLELCECHYMQSFPDMTLPASLQELKMEWCESLASLPSDMRRLTSLQKLSLLRCPKIQSLSDMSLTVSLQELYIDYCESLASLSPDMRRLTSLRKLSLLRCPKIQSLSDMSLPASLQELYIDYCESLTSLPSDMRGLTSLHILEVRRCDRIRSMVDVGLPASLQKLEIASCWSLASLPSDMVRLTSLHTFWLYNCPALRSFPKSGLPPSLSTLTIFLCPALEKKYRSRHGRTLISHVPHVHWIQYDSDSD